MLAWINLLRPKQWIKNGFVIAPIFFAMQFGSLEAWGLVLSAALAFSCAASFIYIINDIMDREEDRKHPVKCKRPVACGAISIPLAFIIAFIVAAIGGVLLSTLPDSCMVIALLYVSANIGYTLVLKHHALLDVFFIAGCFVLRVLMGCYALGVLVSPWIILTTFMLALFLGFGKRYHELSVDGYAEHKRSLRGYSANLLDHLVTICATSAFVCYAIYTTEISHKIEDVSIVYTVVFVAFGLFRYLQSIYLLGQGGEPEMVILKDRWQLVNIMLWLITTLAILSGHHSGFHAS